MNSHANEQLTVQPDAVAEPVRISKCGKQVRAFMVLESLQVGGVTKESED